MIYEKEVIDPNWISLFKVGAYSAIIMFCFILIQIIIYSIWMPPDTVEEIFELFQKNWFLGLLSLDLLYILDCILLVLIYLSLYLLLKKQAPVLMLISTVLGIIGVASYFSSNTAFEMLSLSQQYARTSIEVERFILIAAGKGMLETYTGTAFDIYYVLNTVVLFLYFPAMLKSRYMGKSVAYTGLAAGILMIIPSSAGQLGMIFSLASLVPWLIWLVLVNRKLLRAAKI
jgi:hypothetical protein